MSHSVLAGVDGSGPSSATADWAAREAALRGVPLRLFRVSPPLPGPAVPGPAGDRLRHVGARMLQRTVAGLADRYPDLQVRSEQADDAPAPALLAAARDAGLLVVGPRGTGGFEGLAVGSVALRMAAAPCPVVLVPQPSRTSVTGTHPAHAASQVVAGFDTHHPVGEVADFAGAPDAVRGCGAGCGRSAAHQAPGDLAPTHGRTGRAGAPAHWHTAEPSLAVSRDDGEVSGTAASVRRRCRVQDGRRHSGRPAGGTTPGQRATGRGTHGGGDEGARTSDGAARRLAQGRSPWTTPGDSGAPSNGRPPVPLRSTTSSPCPGSAPSRRRSTCTARGTRGTPTPTRRPAAVPGRGRSSRAS